MKAVSTRPAAHCALRCSRPGAPSPVPDRRNPHLHPPAPDRSAEIARPLPAPRSGAGRHARRRVLRVSAWATCGRSACSITALKAPSNGRLAASRLAALARGPGQLAGRPAAGQPATAGTARHADLHGCQPTTAQQLPRTARAVSVQLASRCGPARWRPGSRTAPCKPQSSPVTRRIFQRGHPLSTQRWPS